MKIALILPCYNESENLYKIEKEFIKSKKLLGNIDFKLLIVNNGSTDNTKNILNNEIFSKKSIKIINLKKNIGYGHGIKQGIKSVNADIYAWAHGDLQTPFIDIISCLLCALKDNHKIVAGKRLTKGIQKNQSKLFDDIISLCLNLKAHDINAQPKIFPSEYKKYFLLQECPNNFALDMYYFKVFNNLNKSILRYEVKFEDRINGGAKGGQGSIITRILLLIKMSLSALKIRKINFANNKT